MDNTGDDIRALNANWSFSGDVNEKFDDHVTRSVPLYREGHDLVTKISDFFLQDGSVCYELGCSTGTLLHAVAERNQNKSVQYIGVDRETDMIQQCQTKYSQSHNIEWLVQDIMDLEFAKADLIIAHYTIQFVKPKNRQLIFNRIYQALNWGGAFVLFEKVRAPDARFQDISTALYTDYKVDQGYTPEEILAKTRSLKGVLEPFSRQGNIDLLARSGFVDMMTIMKYVCFEGFLAIK